MPKDLQRVLDAVLDGVLVVDLSGVVEFVNAEACRILETSALASLGSGLEQVLGPDHPVAKLARSVLDSGRSAIESEQQIERRFAAAVLADVAASPLLEDDRSPSGAVVVLRDRTIQQSMREVATERERLSDFGQIAAGIAHEVKNPLGGIRGAAEILASRASDDRNREAAELIVREVDRITTLVDDLMVFAQGEAVRFAPVNIHQVLDEVLDLLAMDPLAAGVEIERSFDPSIPDMLADEDRLIQVFLNLSRNALQALDGRGGKLSIETRMSLEHRLASEGGRRLPTLLVSVADDGAGIAPEVIGEVKKPFFTTRRGGTGLGLAVSRHWVARHGGTLHIESEPGAGTRVRVALPLRRDAEVTS